MNQRIEFIDLAKGICISLVVLYHVLGEMCLDRDFILIMLFFRMPLYFILSGLFFKTYGGIIPFIKKKTNKLLIPFIFTFVFIVIPSVLILDRVDGTSISLHSFFEGKGRLHLRLDPSSWFLVCLFIVNIYFFLIYTLSKSNIKLISFFCFVLGISGYLMYYYGFYFPLWFDTSLTVMPFFLCGYLARNYSDVLYGKTNIKYFLFSLTTLLFCYYVLEKRSVFPLSFFQNNYSVNMISLYLGGVSGSYCIILIAKYFQHIPVFSYIGRYSIIVLLTHQPLLFFIRNLFYKIGISQDSIIINLLIFVITILLSIPIISFCIRFLPYCFAQKDIWK